MAGDRRGVVKLVVKLKDELAVVGFALTLLSQPVILSPTFYSVILSVHLYSVILSGRTQSARGLRSGVEGPLVSLE